MPHFPRGTKHLIFSCKTSPFSTLEPHLHSQRKQFPFGTIHSTFPFRHHLVVTVLKRCLHHSIIPTTTKIPTPTGIHRISTATTTHHHHHHTFSPLPQYSQFLKSQIHTMTSTEPIQHNRDNTIVLFDVDGTLTPARLSVEKEMKELLPELRKRVTIGFVGGSDLVKQKEQLGDNVLEQFDYGFAENGLDAYKGTDSIQRTSYIEWIGEEKHRKLVEWLLVKLAKLDVPIKRGTFIEFRSGMLNVSPIGRNCSQKEREWFAEYDAEHGIRKQLVEELKKEFKDYGLTFSIGGQISIDVFPSGWDKTYCLRYVRDKFDHIYFFGDKTMEGGNDYEIYSSDETIGHTVKSYHDTVRLCKELFMKE